MPMYHGYRYRFINMRTGTFEKLPFEERELTFLPSGERRRVKLHELKPLINSRGYPWSMLAAHFAGVRFIDELPDEPTFINVQVVEGVPTTVELYNSRVGYRAYGDFEQAWKDTTDVVVAIGAFSHHFRHFAKVLPGEFYYYNAKRRSRYFYAPLRKLGIDITFWSLLATGKGPYHLAAEHGVPNQQPIALARFLWDYLKIPALYRILSSLLNIDRHHMQLTFRDRLKSYIVYQAYLDRGYILSDLPRAECSPSVNQVYVRRPGIYYDVVEYDIRSAYPTTVIVRGIDPYDRDVFPDLMRTLLSFRDSYDGVPADFSKLLANSLIGMMKYELSAFRNECAWARVINGVYEVWHPVSERAVWANVDSAILPADVGAPDVEGYNVREVNRFRWLVVYDDRRLLGQTYEDEFVHKGINPSYYWGEAVRLPVFWDRVDSALDYYIASDPKRVYLPLSESLDVIKRVILDSLSDDPRDYLLTFAYSPGEAVKNPYRAYVVPRLQRGITHGVLTKEGFKPPEEVNLSELDWSFYISAAVYALSEHFQSTDAKASRVLADRLSRDVRKRFL